MVNENQVKDDGTINDEKSAKTWSHLEGVPNNQDVIKMITEILEIEFNPAIHLEEISQIIHNETKEIYKLHWALIGLRKCLSIETDNPIQQV